MRFHIVKRDQCPLWKKCCFYVGAVVIALLLGAVLLLSMGVNPLAYYSQMFTMGTVGNRIAYKVFINYLKDFVPLVLVSVALSLAFKMRFWNIGGEGQFILGAISAAFVAFKLGPLMPSWMTLLIMCLAAMVVDQEASECRQVLQRYVAAQQWKYEKLLTSIREMYKSGALSLGEKGFHITQSGEVFDHTTLTSGLSITPLDSRVVLLSTDRGGAQSIRTTDMPLLGDAPRMNLRSVKTLDTERIYDIGILLTTEGGVMALVHYRNDGAFVLRQLTETVYIELLLCRTNPALCIDDLYVPEDRTPAFSVSPTSPYEVILLP